MEGAVVKGWVSWGCQGEGWQVAKGRVGKGSEFAPRRLQRSRPGCLRSRPAGQRSRPVFLQFFAC